MAITPAGTASGAALTPAEPEGAGGGAESAVADRPTPLTSGGSRLQYHLARPPSSAARDATRTGLVIAHGLPNSPGGAARAAQTYPELADRVAADTGWAALSLAFRGTSGSAGSFSPGNWLADLQAAVSLLRAEVSNVWLAGFGLGGTIALRAAALDPAIGGLAVLATPTDLSTWAAHPDDLAAEAAAAGALPAGVPEDLAQWTTDLRAMDPLASAAAIPPRPFLIVHGSADDEVPLVDARALHDAAEGHGDLRVIPMAGHRLRHDPRTIAVLLGWLERHQG